MPKKPEVGCHRQESTAESWPGSKSGKYPVIRKLYMNTKGAPQGVVASFISYIQGPEGAAITASDGYIPTK